jgi:hypothetical protein
LHSSRPSAWRSVCSTLRRPLLVSVRGAGFNSGRSPALCAGQYASTMAICRKSGSGRVVLCLLRMPQAARTGQKCRWLH